MTTDQLLAIMQRPANPLTTTGTMQPWSQLQPYFRYDAQGYFDQTGFIDAPTFFAAGAGYSYQGAALHLITMRSGA